MRFKDATREKSFLFLKGRDDKDDDLWSSVLCHVIIERCRPTESERRDRCSRYRLNKH